MRRALYLAAALAGLLGVLALRDATLTTHHAVDAGSRIELVVRVAQRGAERGQTSLEMFDALLAHCRLEVNSDPVGPSEELRDGRYRAVLRPSMDTSNRRQFRGCLEDWTIDELRVDVLRLDEVDAP